MYIMPGVAGKHLYIAYAGLQKSLHQEWTFVQHVTLDTGTEFHTTEDTLRNVFLLELFKVATPQIPGRGVTVIPFKQSEIALPEPIQTAGYNWTVSCVITGHLITALRVTA